MDRDMTIRTVATQAIDTYMHLILQDGLTPDNARTRAAEILAELDGTHTICENEWLRAHATDERDAGPDHEDREPRLRPGELGYCHDCGKTQFSKVGGRCPACDGRLVLEGA